MAARESPLHLGDVFSGLHQGEAGAEERSPEDREEGDLEKTLSISTFGELISQPSSQDLEKQRRSYSEKDFECHRHTSHHIHHPLSSHLPASMTFQRKAPRGEERWKKKKRKKEKSPVQTSGHTPSIREVNEEEEEVEEEEEEGDCVIEIPEKELNEEAEATVKPMFSIGGDEETLKTLSSDSLHQPERDALKHMTMDCNPPEHQESPDDTLGSISGGWEQRKPSSRAVRYDLKERICLGSMLAPESAAYQRVPTDEAEAQMLASADLDDMKNPVSGWCDCGTKWTPFGRVKRHAAPNEKCHICASDPWETDDEEQ